MAGVNKVIILGRFGKDPEITYTPAGMAVCKFQLATSKKKKDSSYITSWHRCIAFDKRAEIIAKFMSKGKELFIEGELSYGQYEKDGIVRYTTDIIVSQFTFISGNESGNRQNNNNPQYNNNYQPGNNNQRGNQKPYTGNRF